MPPTATQSAPASTDAPSANGNAPTRKSRDDSKRWLYFEVTPDQRKGLSEMAKVAGGKAADFYRSLLSPAIDSALADFESNREVVAARARVAAAQTAAQKAAELAEKAKADLAAIEGKS